MIYKIMVIEDDSTIANAIKEHLKRWDYEVICSDDFKNIVQQVVQKQPHLILMDIALPYFNGFYWCSQIRTFSQVPIIFISSASDSMNIVMAVNMGGDDFIAKPFDFTVLTAKVQALLRRVYSFKEQTNVIEHHGVVLNLSEGTLLFNQQKVELTRNDFKILELLMTHAGQMVSRTDIMERLWQSDSFIDDNTLTVSMTRLRKKLDEIGLTDFIRTKKGFGYLIQ